MIVVFSGYNQRAVVAFLRTLEKNKINYKIIASGLDDQVFFTAYKEKVVYTRKIKSLDLQDIIIGLKKINKEKINIIAPSTEALNRFLLQNRDSFESLGFKIPLVKKQLYETISDKEKFVKECCKNDILVPKEYKISKYFERSLVAKPKSYVGSTGDIISPIFILNQKDLTYFINHYVVDDFNYQEYLKEGRSVYLLFYFDKNGNFWLLSQENFIQQPGGKSMQCAKITEDFKDTSIVGPYIQLFKRLKFRGFVMVEIKIINNNYYMIEANPRFWGPSQLFCDADYNLFECFLYDYGLLNNKPAQNLKMTYYFWSNGIPAEMIEKSDAVFHGEGKKIFQQNIKQMEKVDIYNRKDTNMIYKIERLKWLYNQTSKHSNYQILPKALKKIIGDDLPIKSRFEEERLKYIKSRVKIEDKQILDIGGNTGFFTIQSVIDGAKQVDYYEGNKIHADFVEMASGILKIQQKINIFPKYYNFKEITNKKKYDIVYNLNVLHHLGDDFDVDRGKAQAKKDIIDAINRMAEITKVMVFQLGFNWKGNKDEGLFAKGTKEELIKYIEQGTNNCWKILHIGVAVEEKDGRYCFEDVNEKNIIRQDAFGEFLNRPLFIMESKK